MRDWITMGCGVAAGVLAAIGLPAGILVLAVVLAVGGAVLAVRYAATAGTYVVLVIAVAALAVTPDRPPAWQVALVATAAAAFLLVPAADRLGVPTLVAAAVGVPVAAAITVLAQHEGRSSGPYVAGLAALLGALALAVLPALRRGSPETVRRRNRMEQ